MDSNNLVAEYLEYLERMCGFSASTLKQHKRFCGLWENFLRKKDDKDILEAAPADLLAYIDFRLAHYTLIFSITKRWILIQLLLYRNSSANLQWRRLT